MRRKLMIGGLSLLGLLLLLIIGVVVYIRSGKLDVYLEAQVKEALADFGVRAEFGNAHLDLRGYRVTLENIRLYAGDGQKPFGEIDKLSAQFSVLSYLHQKLKITQVEVVHPHAWLEIDEQGQFNLASLHAPPSKKEAKESGVIFLTSNFEVSNGEITFIDLKRDITAQMTNLAVHLVPLEPESIVDTLNHRLELGFAGATATVEGRKINDITANILARVTEQDAEILAIGNDPQFKITSDLGQLKINGRVQSFEPLKYELNDVRVDASLAQVARVFAPEIRMDGNIDFKGQVAGTGGDYRATGSLESTTLTVAGFRVAGVRVKSDISGHGDEYKGKANLATSEISGNGLTIASLSFNDSLKGKQFDFDVTGGLNLASLKSGEVSVNGLKGSLSLDNAKASLSQFSAQVLGGDISGTASVAYSAGTSSVDLQFNSIDLEQAATLASAKDVKVRGTANGNASLTFPRFDYKAAKGQIEASFDAAVSPPEEGGEASPAKGELRLFATGRGFNIDRAFVRSRQSDLTVTGSMGWDGGGSLAVDFKSADMSEVQRALDAFGAIPPDVRDQYEIGLDGAGEFKGRVEGELSDPSVSGHLKLASIKSHDEETGSFEGDIAYSASRLRVDNASLMRPDDSRAEFSVDAPLPVKDNVAVKARVQNFDLAAILGAISPGLKDYVSRGVVNGTVDLRGLPGPRTVEGTANLTLAAAEFNQPAQEEGQEDKKISVPEFTGDLALSKSVINVQNLRMRVGDSEITGQGTYNLDTYEYSINAEGKNLDLARLSDAAQTVKVTGNADVIVAGQGKWGKADDWSGVQVNATIQGHNVAVEGRDFGDAKLVAFTEGGILKVEASGKLLDQQRTLEATIDLRDRDHYPINAAIEFTESDIGPYLALISPELSGISGTATGTIKLSGPLLDTDKVQAVATLTKLEFGGAISEQKTYRVTNQGNIVLTATPRDVRLDRVMFTGEGTSVTLEGILSRDAARSNLAVNGEINLRLLSSFTPTIFTTGVAQVQATIVGALDSPQLLGVANLRDVGVRILDFPLSIARGNGQVRFTSNQAVVENFVAATPGGGSISIQGGAALAGLAPAQWRLEARADQIGAEYPKDTLTVVDAQVALEGNRRLQVLSGNVQVRRASYTRDITIEELLTTGGPFQADFLEAGPGGPGGPSGLPTVVDLHITADNTLIIKNNLADAVGSAYINLRGSLDEPQASGRILLSRGTLNFRNGQYELTRGMITIPPRRGVEPYIDFQSEADIRGYHISITFNGALSKLQTNVRSEPELPEPDIVSLILTGNISTDRSTEASVAQTGLGLAQSILSASLSERLERGTQRLFGLSRFSIDPLLVGRGNDPTARITIGQRITKDLTVTFSQNLTAGVSGIDRVVLVEYRLSNRFSVVGFRNERGELGFDVRLRKKF
ncbi:MAG TPA: translocation/assembly module TamB domain-containing protein [Blastocatellia bacterium]|nr:translocation/assembly module TamB domain-containing protein [Blastocatellia bacterium]